MKLTSTSTRLSLVVAAAAVALGAPAAALARIPEGGAAPASQSPPASDQVVVPCRPIIPIGFGGSAVTATHSCGLLPLRSSVISPARATSRPLVNRFVAWAAEQDAVLAGR